jgi:hypothetical protein
MKAKKYEGRKEKNEFQNNMKAEQKKMKAAGRLNMYVLITTPELGTSTTRSGDSLFAT